MFILLDQSGSMVLSGQDRWNPIVSAIKTFVGAPEIAGVGIGLNYFGLHPPGQPPVDPTSPGSCNANDYARPEVPIDLLPNARTAIENSLNLHTAPGGGTPTHPALQGSMQYVTGWALTNPNRKAVIVLATDGVPQGCTGNDLNAVYQVAAAGVAANPPIHTYLIGVGPDSAPLNQILVAGGAPGLFVESGNGQQFLDALKQVRAHANACEFALPTGPSGQTVDFARLNLLFTPPSGGEGFIYRVESPNDCRVDTGGWYYGRDKGNNPVRIDLCHKSCEQVRFGGQLDFALGCLSVPPP